MPAGGGSDLAFVLVGEHAGRLDHNRQVIVLVEHLGLRGHTHKDSTCKAWIQDY